MVGGAGGGNDVSIDSGGGGGGGNDESIDSGGYFQSLININSTQMSLFIAYNI